jgi:hypothetical protein
MSGPEVDNWFSMCEHWRELAREHYEPISESKCNEIVQDTLQTIRTHKLPEDTKENGTSGWRSSIHLDADERYIRFLTSKTLHADMKQVVDHSWALYQDGELFRKAHHGDNCEVFLQVVQQVSPDVMIVQRVEKFPDVQLTHSLVIIFRVQTEAGYTIVCRCIESPKLQSVMKAEGFNLCGSFHWETFDAQGESDKMDFALVGSIGSENPTYARRWRDEITSALERYENQYVETPNPSN